MMEPRWHLNWIHRRKRFVGGTPEADLWLTYNDPTNKSLNAVKSIRIVIGPSVDEWGWAFWDEHRDELDVITGGGSRAKSYINNNREQLSTYLRLFVPELSTKEN